MSETAAWPPSNGVTSKIIPRDSAVFQISYSTVVRAPAPLVFDTILHAADYPAWNTWVPRAEILTQPSSTGRLEDQNAQDRMSIGCTMRFTVVMNAGEPNDVTLTPLKVVDICTPSSPTSYLTPELLEDPTFTADLSKVYRVSWTGNGGMYAFGMKLERFHEVVVTGENECEVRTWEIMSGILSRVVKLMYEDTLKGKVGLWCEDLKKYCEKMHKGPVDVERQCGVSLPTGGYCTRSLTCKSHSMGSKRAVPGRSQPYDELLAQYQKKNQATEGTTT